MEIGTPYSTLTAAALGSAAAPSAAAIRTAVQPGAAAEALAPADSSDLSPAARALAAAAELPEVRQERVEALQQQIASGTYAVPPQDVADALLRQFRG